MRSPRGASARSRCATPPKTARWHRGRRGSRRLAVRDRVRVETQRAHLFTRRFVVGGVGGVGQQKLRDAPVVVHLKRGGDRWAQQNTVVAFFGDNERAVVQAEALTQDRGDGEGPLLAE